MPHLLSPPNFNFTKFHSIFRFTIPQSVGRVLGRSFLCDIPLPDSWAPTRINWVIELLGLMGGISFSKYSNFRYTWHQAGYFFMLRTVYSQNGEIQNGENKKSKKTIRHSDFCPIFLKRPIRHFWSSKRDVCIWRYGSYFFPSLPKNSYSTELKPTDFQKWILQLPFCVPDYSITCC
jgi:hypothetical protein